MSLAARITKTIRRLVLPSPSALAPRSGPWPSWVVAPAAARMGAAIPRVATLIIVLAAAVRIVGLNRYGFNSDEAVYSGQAAALAGYQQYAQLFGVFRAHPLLVHFIVSLAYRLSGVNDVVPRLIAVAFGLGLVAVAGAAARVAYGRGAGLVTMAFVALSPYAVTVSRQMLLDGPMAFFFALSILFLALYVRGQRLILLCAAAAAAGMAFLSKETAILMVPAIVLFMLFTRDLPIKLRHIAAAGLTYLLVVSPYPLSLAVTGSGKLAQQFFVWQLFRRSNHEATFYLSTVAPSIGLPILILALVGVGMALRRRKGTDPLLISLTLVSLAFYQLWPVKGFQYLLPLITPLAILAANGLLGIGALIGAVRLAYARHRNTWSPWAAKGALLVGSLAILAGGSLTVIAQVPERSSPGEDSNDLTRPPFGFIAGTGGLEAGRPAGEWIREHTLADSRFLAIGPSFANLIEFYGQRRSVALSVSTNPLHRNPTYEPVRNPDLLLRRNAIQYLVYDAYSASRSSFFTKQLLNYAKKYDGIIVYRENAAVRGSNGTTEVPVVLIWEVHP